MATQIRSDAFRERFASFIQARFGSGPSTNAAEDAPYFLTRYVLENDLPWRDLFLGPYRVVATEDRSARVERDPDGLGYFRSDAWLRRYAGNAPEGLKLATAYRILNNITGVEVKAVTTPPGFDVSSQGRKKPECATCHFTPWYALDPIARVLTRRKGVGAEMTFTPSPDGPQKVLGGVTVKDDRELVTALVASKDFEFRACRLAFLYLYGRAENRCEADVFDACMDAFDKDGRITSAVAAVAGHPSFCQ